MSYDAEILGHEQPHVAEILQAVMFDATEILEPVMTHASKALWHTISHIWRKSETLSDACCRSSVAYNDPCNI